MSVIDLFIMDIEDTVIYASQVVSYKFQCSYYKRKILELDFYSATLAISFTGAISLESATWIFQMTRLTS